MVLDDDAGFPAGCWLTDTGPGYRRVRGCGSNSLPGPWDFSSWLFGAGDVPDIEGWSRCWNGPASPCAPISGHFMPCQAFRYPKPLNPALRAVSV